MIIPTTAIAAMWPSVISENLYKPCLRETRSVFGLMSNSRIPNQKFKSPFVKKDKIRGSQSIGSGFLKWDCAVNPYWYQPQNLVFVFASK